MTEEERRRRKKKGMISEDDTVSLLQSYGATTIFTLLQEVAQYASDVKIDWKAIVTRSSTGISNPREYQMLWRHLAYREPLLENIDGAEPMDDDSDLEFELETVPPVNAEDRSHAEKYVKVLMSSIEPGQNDSALEVHTTFETSNDPRPNTTLGKELATPPAYGKTTPVSLRKQSESTIALGEGLKGNVTAGACSASNGRIAEGFEENETVGTWSANDKRKAEGFDGNETVGACVSMKKKRKLWTGDEDTELVAAVELFGEGNWTTILDGHFKHDRTASQLSQRWSVLKKRLGKSNTGCYKNSISLAKSEALDAARLALNSALNMPTARRFSVTNAGFTQTTTTPKISRVSPMASEGLCRPPAHQNPSSVQETLNQTAPEKGTVTPSNKPQSHPTTPVKTPDSTVKAVAYAVGARLVEPSSAASMLTPAPFKKVVHIRTGVSPSTSTANKGRQLPSSYLSRPFMIPPHCTILSQQRRGKSDLAMKSHLAMLHQSSSPGNTKKFSKETSESDRGGELSAGLAGGRSEMEPGSVLNHDQKASLEENKKDSSMGEDVNITVDNINAT